MPRKKVARTRSNYLENVTDGVGLMAGLQPIANATYPSSTSSPQSMLQRKRSVNVNHLHSYRTKGSAPNQGHTSSNLEQLDSYFPVHTTSLDQFPFSLSADEMCTDRNQTDFLYLDVSSDQKLCPVSFAEKTTDPKLLDTSMSGVRSAERSMESSILRSYHSDPSAFQSMSVRSPERSIELNVLNSYHLDAPAPQSMSVRSPERSIESNGLQNSKLLNIKTARQVTSFNPSMSDVRPAERSIELNKLCIYQFHPSAFNLHPAGLSQDSTDSKILEYNYWVQNGNFDLSISDMRSAERSLVLVPN